MREQDFKQIVVEIKKQITATQTEIMKQANKHLLDLYLELGKIISEKSSWGNKFVDSLSTELKLDFPYIKGFSVRNLKNMKRFYEEYKNNEIMQTVSAQIPWSHNTLIIEKIKDNQIRKWYIEQTSLNGWSYDVLSFQIKNDIYERQIKSDKLNNFDRTLIDSQSDLANEMQKDPYIFDIATLRKNYIEKELEKALVERIKNVLIELGNGFSFVGSQYKITVGDKEYFIDLLFYHLNLRCFIVVELKINDFRPEHAGKLNFYLSAIDDNLRKEHDNPTIGLILCQEKDKFTVEYALRDIHKPIGVSSYEIAKIIPKEVLENLPTEEDINLHIDIKEDLEEN